jgi:hypothetical protein
LSAILKYLWSGIDGKSTTRQVVGLAANSHSLLHLLRERLLHRNHNRMVLLLIHLTVADLCVILVGLPLEMAWTATVSWWADGPTCKVSLQLALYTYR